MELELLREAPHSIQSRQVRQIVAVVRYACNTGTMRLYLPYDYVAMALLPGYHPCVVRQTIECCSSISAQMDDLERNVLSSYYSTELIDFPPTHPE